MNAFSRLSLKLFLAMLATPVVFSCVAFSQNAGNNAVCPATGTSCTITNVLPSPAFIDAKQFQGAVDICRTLYSIISSATFPTTGAVIDARGVSVSSACTTNHSPWYDGTTYLNKPAQILLPAGTIVISYQWVLPNGTKLIGEGTNASPSSGSFQTTIQASSSFSSTQMIELGDSHCPTFCIGISVENLTLDGNGNSIVGILNQFAQDSSYVDHVNIYNVVGTGLQVTQSSGQDLAKNSGPYTNITFDTGGSSGGVCANITVNGTRGIHGLKCTSNTSTNAVFLDASNTSIEDVTIKSFDNGVVVGSVANAQSDVLVNIYGDTSFGTTPVNVVKIGTNATDLSLLGISNAGGSGTKTIDDTQTSRTLTDQYVAIYALGEQSSGGWSRFTTSQNAATWAAGVSGAAAPTFSCSQGSIYSDTSSTGGKFYACTSSGWQQVVPVN